ncbi:hypothetical protein BH11PSE14_BH11PSE14_22670 [soil metagenome]
MHGGTERGGLSSAEAAALLLPLGASTIYYLLGEHADALILLVSVVAVIALTVAMLWLVTRIATPAGWFGFAPAPLGLPLGAFVLPLPLLAVMDTIGRRLRAHRWPGEHTPLST